MFDDRLEITSPGGMFGGKRIQEVDILHVPSSRRNPVISDVFHRLKYMERRGSGIKKILKEYEEDVLPQFFSDQQYFIVTLKNKNYVEVVKADVSSELEIKTTSKTTLKTTQIKHKTTQKNEEKIIRIISKNPDCSQTEIAAKLGDVSVDGVKYHIKKLKEKGVLRRIGASKGGHWEIVENK